jgi:L-threonylcarbamoyladenylate synthase
MTSTTSSSSSTPSSSTSFDTKNASATPPTAQRVSLAQLAACGQRLREGRLVAFPTETVYGLGCHALDEAACMAVFAAKERPLTDPLIVHVHEATAAFGLWEATAGDNDNSNNLQRRVLHSLADAFWPGPLTLVARASHAVPAVVMAGTGYCAARCPQHPVALALLEAAAVPVAAPSANKFGHVSPTTAQHVWDDLQAEDVWIVEETQEEDLAQQGGDKGSPRKDSSTSCHVGVESSVAKLEMDQATDGAFSTTGRLTVLRQGAVSVQDLQQALAAAGLGDAITVVAQSTARVALTTASVAPGQSIRHYSPHVPSYLLSASCCGVTTPSARILAQAVVLDYGSQLVGWQSSALAYRDTSPTACAAEAAQGIYQTLRWAEQVPEARFILFAPPVSSAADQPADALLLAVQDRLQRAASGVVLDSLEELEVSSTSLEQ